MRQTRAQIAKPDIVKAFDDERKNVFTMKEIGYVMAWNRTFWRLPISMSVPKFIEFLVTQTPMQKVVVPFKPPYRPVTRFVWGDVSLLPVLLSIRPSSYLTHYTAIDFHGLTQQSVNSVYVNSEQHAVSSGAPLTQDSLDRAFRKNPRSTKYQADYSRRRIIMINGRNTGRAGVIRADVTDPVSGQSVNVDITSLERTLLDAVIRPQYCGGVPEVASSFALAQEKVSVNALLAMLKSLELIYPYHQCLGFYMDYAGRYSQRSIDWLQEFPREFDFYVAHGLKDTEYCEKWRLHVPKGMNLA